MATPYKSSAKLRRDKAFAEFVGYPTLIATALKNLGAVSSANPVFTGQSSIGSGGAAGAQQVTVNQKTAVADNTLVDLFTVTVPNNIAGATVRMLVTGTLGDGDSTDSKEYILSVSRITGAAAKATIGSAVGAAATAGATANAATTGSLSAIAGAVGAANTFTIQAKVARSAGASTNHVITAQSTLLNANASGVTIAAA